MPALFDVLSRRPPRSQCISVCVRERERTCPCACASARVRLRVRALVRVRARARERVRMRECVGVRALRPCLAPRRHGLDYGVKGLWRRAVRRRSRPPWSSVGCRGGARLRGGGGARLHGRAHVGRGERAR
eukprot:1401510-Pleurochrysis_carterae.AAC.3